MTDPSGEGRRAPPNRLSRAIAEKSQESPGREGAFRQDGSEGTAENQPFSAVARSRQASQAPDSFAPPLHPTAVGRLTGRRSTATPSTITQAAHRELPMSPARSQTGKPGTAVARMSPW